MVSPSRVTICSLLNQIAFGETGQNSSHTMHGVSMAQGKQRPRSINAVPRRIIASSSAPTFCFSVTA
jgi:hypothetical protein